VVIHQLDDFKYEIFMKTLAMCTQFGILNVLVVSPNIFGVKFAKDNRKLKS